jgi:hypothetical protein
MNYGGLCWDEFNPSSYGPIFYFKRRTLFLIAVDKEVMSRLHQGITSLMLDKE